ncbi:MAG: DEAD/DEAH box helicase [Candidatus Nanoarchaeia archaeon]|nr:DEAD/DEAH box helicase [Candidatus Nanoarchaeia archaeon]
MLHPKITEIIGEEYGDLFEYQKVSFKHVHEGKDVLITAPTGYGKTQASMIGVFNDLINDKEEGIKCLYITPLKALNRDIFDRIVQWGVKLGIKIDVRHGDTKQSERVKQSKNPPSIMITTPETVQALLIGKRLREHLKKLKYVIIDEIHELAGDKRGAQLSIGLERLRLLSPNFQKIGLSATVSNISGVRDYLSQNCETVRLDADKKYDIEVLKANPEGEDLEYAEKQGVGKEVAWAVRKINEIINCSKSTLVFVNTRQTAELLGSKLKRINEKVEVHHSSLSKESRLSTEDGFRKGEIKAIVCTSSMELGIDVGDIETVVQFTSPREVTRLIQRVGRSGHSKDRVSKGILLTTNTHDYLEAVSIVQNLKNLETLEIIEKPYDVLIHGIVGYCMDFRDPKIEFVYNSVKKSHVYRNLSKEEFRKILDFMKQVNLIGEFGDVIGKTRKGMLYYYDNLSMIPSIKTYFVINEQNNSKIGVLDEEFVAENIELGKQFVCRGEPWRVTKLDGDRIFVIRIGATSNNIPVWDGENIPVPYLIAKTADELRSKIKDEFIDRQKKYFLHSVDRIFLEINGEYLVVHSSFGTKINKTLYTALTALLSSKYGISIALKSDAYGAVIRLPDRNFDAINASLLNIGEGWLKEILKLSLKNNSNFNWTFVNVAKRCGVLKKNAEINKRIVKKLIEIYKDSIVYEESFNEEIKKHMDIENSEKILEKIRKKLIKVERNDGNVSPFGEFSLKFHLNEFVNPENAYKEVVEHVKNRLKNKVFRFYCIKCGQYLGKNTYISAKDKINCIKCDSGLITFFPEYKDFEKIVKKIVKNKKIIGEDIKIAKDLEKKAHLYLSHGKKTCLIFAGVGVGATNAYRILCRDYENEDELIKEIIRREKNYLRTREFWKN